MKTSGVEKLVVLRAFALSLIVSMLVSSLVFAGQSVIAKADHPGKVTICHASDSNTNPYVTETPDIENDGSLSGGHLNHTGPIWNPTLKASHIQWGDIIPPYTDGSFVYPGMNWTTDGQTIYNNGCNLPTLATPSPTPSGTPISTPTGTPTSTPTSGPTWTPTSTPTSTPTGTGTPTGTPTLSPTSTPCVGESCPTSVPTVTPTSSPVIESTPTPPTCGADEHLDLTGTKCLKWELGGAPNPPSSSNGQVLGISTTSSDPKGQVLGDSTTRLASTSSDLEMPRVIIGIIASALSFFVIKKAIL